jgi:hypothetical protein
LPGPIGKGFLLSLFFLKMLFSCLHLGIDPVSALIMVLKIEIYFYHMCSH